MNELQEINQTKPEDQNILLLNVLNVRSSAYHLIDGLVRIMELLSTQLLPDRLYTIRFSEVNHLSPFPGLLLPYGQSIIETPKEDEVPLFITNQPAFQEKLLNNEIVEGVTGKTISAGLKKSLEAHQIASYLLVPLFVRGSFWGVMAFIETSIPRFWRRTVKEELKTIAQVVGHFISEKELAQELAIKDKLLQKAIESSNDGYWHIDLAQNKVFFSKQWKRMLGFEADELESSFQTFEQLIHPDDRDLVLRILDPYAKTGLGTFECQYRLKNKEGKYLWVLTKASVQLNKAGMPVQFVATNIDITSRVQYKINLDKEEKKFKNLINSVHEVIFKINARGQYTFLNSSWELFTQFSPEKTLNTLALRYIHPEDREYAWNMFMSSIKDKSSDHKVFEVRFITKSGNPIWLEANASIQYDSKGEVQEINGTLIDINQRKLAEEARRESEEKFTRIAESMNDLILVLSASDELLYISPSSMDIQGIAPESALGKYAMDFVHPEDREMLEQQMYLPLNNGASSVVGQFRLRRADGSYVWVESIAQPLGSSADNLTFLAVIRDITARKMAQEELENTLSREKELSELKSRFITMASHEFRTPLSSIKSSAELLDMYAEDLGDNIPKPFLNHLTKINNQVDRLGELMNNILIAGSTESEDLPFNPEKAVLHQFIESYMKEKFSYGEDTRVIKVAVENDPLPALFDHEMMGQIVQNVLSNALKFSKGAPAPQCLVRYEEHGVRLIVSDEGIGIPDEEQSRLFSSFFRANNITNSNIPGNGLGLVIVKRAVDAHGGVISIESDEDIGTTVSILFPYEPQSH